MSEVKSGDAWAEFWSGDHSIYVNARHARVHYDRIARDLTVLLASRARPRVLDWGCGDALSAPKLTEACGELLLYDGVAAVRERLAHRFADARGVRVLDETGWAGLPARSVDVVVLNSVAQYLSRAALERLLEEFRRILHPEGEVILADIIPPSAGMLPDALSLLGSGARNGFFLAAALGLVRTFFSDYRKIRERAGFSTYDEDRFLKLLARHGFAGVRLASNVGFNQQRMTFRARPRVNS